MKPKNIKNLQSESRKLRVRQMDKHTFVVESATERNTHYLVTVSYDPDGIILARCNCPWAEHQGVACSHALAALEYLADKRARTLSFWLNKEDAERQKHRTFYLTDSTDKPGIWITSRSA